MSRTEHSRSQCRAQPCGCWCEACERHNAEPYRLSPEGEFSNNATPVTKLADEREQARERVIAAAREAVVYAPTDLRVGRLSKVTAALAALDRLS